MVRQPSKHITQRPALAGLCFEGCAKLRLSARAPQKHNHHLCDSKSQGSAKIFFHQRETKINAGRYSRRSIATAISNIDGVGIDGDAWVVLCKFARPIPMGGRAPPVEKAGFCQDKRAGTDRTESPNPGALQSEPVQESRFVMQFARAHAPGNQKCIDRPAIFPVCPIRMHGRAEMIRNHAAPASRNDLDFVRQISAAQPIRIAENFCWPEHVEGPHRRDGHNQHPKRASAH